ncbi:MAG: hypothetical protein WD042_17495 [Phycisphaeraceae bacterium]
MNAEPLSITPSVNRFGADPNANLRAGERPASPLKRIHGVLRGRYVWAVLLACLGLILGGWWGYHRRAPMYQSTGTLHFEPILPRVLYATEEKSGIMPMYDRFLANQLDAIKSKRVLDLAVKEQEWLAAGMPANATMVAILAANLEVTNPTGVDRVDVTFSHPKPTVALAGARSVINAYLKVKLLQEEEADQRLFKVLLDRQQSLRTALKDSRDRILAIAEAYKTDALEDLHQNKLKRLDRLETMLKETQWALAAAESQLNSGSAQVALQGRSIQEIAEVDPEVGALLKQKRDLELRFNYLISDKKGENHPAVLEIKRQLASVDGALEIATQAYRSNRPSASVRVPLELDGAPVVMTLEQLKAREQRLVQFYEPLREETEKLGRDSLELRTQQSQAKDVQEQLAETNHRIEQLALEGRVGGRVKPGDPPELPEAPANDARAKWGAVGGFGGAAAGFAFIAMIGFVDRRFRHMDEVQACLQDAPLLGILPSLPKNLAEPEEAASAVHCIHQLRNRLEMTSTTQTRQVFLITSPTSGDGKTSLALALGLSFAGASARTLLIDFDVTGGGLSRCLEPIIRPRIGQILLKRGLISQQQLEDALRLAEGSGQPLGQLLIELDYLDRAGLGEALSDQAMTVGLVDALLSQAHGTAIHQTPIPRLWGLLRGQTGPEDIGRFSAPLVQAFLDEARRQFDVVIVDTGPILGSLEAAMLAPHADAVVLTVSRGTQPALATRALTQLMSLEATVAGIVFNRAEHEDVESYSQSSERSVHYSITPRKAPSKKDRWIGMDSFGPIASAVVWSDQGLSPDNGAGPDGNGTPGGGNGHRKSNGNGKGTGKGNGTPKTNERPAGAPTPVLDRAIDPQRDADPRADDHASGASGDAAGAVVLPREHASHDEAQLHLEVHDHATAVQEHPPADASLVAPPAPPQQTPAPTGEAPAPGKSPESESYDLARRQAEIEHREAELEQQAQQLKEQEAELQVARHELTAGQALLRDATTAMGQEHATAAAQKAELDARECQVQRQLRDLEDRRNQNQARADELAAMHQEILARQAELTESRRGLEDRQGQAATQAADLDRRRDDLGKREAELGTQWAALQRQQQELADQEGSLRQRFDQQDEASESMTAEQAEAARLRQELQKQRTELDHARQTLDEERTSLSSRQAELDALRAELSVQDQTIQAHVDDARRHQAELAAQRLAVEEQGRSVEAQRADLAADRRQLQEAQAALAAAQEELNRQRETAEQERRDLEQRFSASSADQNALERERQALAELRRQLERQQADLTQTRDLLDGQRNDLADARKQLDEQQAKVAQAGQELVQTQCDFAQRQEELRLLRQELDGTRCTLEQRQAQVDQREATLTQSCSTVESQHAQLTEARRQLDEQQAKVADAGEQLRQSQRELERRQEELRQREQDLTLAKEQLESERAALASQPPEAPEAPAAPETPATQEQAGDRAKPLPLARRATLAQQIRRLRRDHAVLTHEQTQHQHLREQLATLRAAMKHVAVTPSQMAPTLPQDDLMPPQFQTEAPAAQEEVGGLGDELSTVQAQIELEDDLLVDDAQSTRIVPELDEPEPEHAHAHDHATDRGICTFRCGACGGKMAVAAGAAGMKARCHHCGKRVRVPTQVAASESLRTVHCPACDHPFAARAASIGVKAIRCPKCLHRIAPHEHIVSGRQR